MMAFKFGLTVMNCLKPNLVESFDLLGSMEAFDTYANLKVAFLILSRKNWVTSVILIQTVQNFLSCRMQMVFQSLYKQFMLMSRVHY